MYDIIMSEEVDMNEQNEDEASVNEEHVDCSDAFNTTFVFHMVQVSSIHHPFHLDAAIPLMI